MIKVVYKKQGVLMEITASNKELVINEKIMDVPLGKRVVVELIPKEEMELVSVRQDCHVPIDNNTLAMLNGYQSWTPTFLYGANDTMKGLAHLPKKLIRHYEMDKYGDTLFARYQKYLQHGVTYAAFEQDNQVTLIGSLLDHQVYTMIYVDRKKEVCYLESDVDRRVIHKAYNVLDYVILNGTHDSVYQAYFRYLPKAPKREKLVGYTSWYNHYQNISEPILEKDLKGLTSDFQVFQIDDGYQTAIGDWLSVDENKFPNGLEGILQRIKDKKLIPGIWLAPFVCETKSVLFQEHPDWILRDLDGKMVKAGCNWSGFYALDISKQEVKEYIQTSLLHYKNMGFKLFKLDFLYAMALVPTKDQTRAESMHQAMKWIREVLTDVFILGCGLPLASGFGLVDYCRIGPDVSLSFDDKWFMKYMLRERVSTKNTILNTIFRRELDGKVFYNDPDVFLLRKENNKMNEKQKQSLLVMNFLFGSLVLTSDTVGDYDEGTRAMLQDVMNYKEVVVKKVERVKKSIIIEFSTKDEHHTIHYQYQKGEIVAWTKQV